MENNTAQKNKESREAFLKDESTPSSFLGSVLSYRTWSKKNLLWGALLACVFPLWMYFVAPEILKFPKDFSFSSEIISIDNFYDAERDAYTGEVYTKTKYDYRTESFDEDTLSLRHSFEVRSLDEKLIFEVSRLYGIDRFSGAHVPMGADKVREGYLFAPSDLREGDSFTYWHVNYDAPAQMVFAGKERIFDLDTYIYTSNYDDVVIDQTENLQHLPGVGISRGVQLEPNLTIWVEPVTGQLVKYKDKTTAYFYDLETGEYMHPWNTFSNSFSNESIQNRVNEVRLEKTEHLFVHTYIPLVLWAGALFLIARGLNVITFFRQKISVFIISVTAAGLVGVIGSISFGGWVFSIESLTRIVPFASKMNPLTALCFILVSAGLFFWIYKKKKLVLYTGSALVAIGSVMLFGSFGVIDFQIDLFLFREDIIHSDVLARMALYTSVSFVLIGCCFMAGASKLLRRIYVVDIVSTLVALFALLALLGFLFDAVEIFNLPVFFAAAVHTAFGFLIAGVSTYFLLRRKTAHRMKFGGWFTVSGSFLVAALFTLTIAASVQNNITSSIESNFNQVTENTTESILDRVRIYISALEGGRGLFVASDEVSREEWKSYIESLEIQENYPGIQGIGYSMFISPEEKNDHEKRIRNEGFEDYAIHPEGERSIYSSIIYLEPFDLRNQEAFGYDMFQEDIRRVAMEEARDTGEAIMSGIVTLVQEIDEDVQPGFLIYVPYYESKDDPGNIADRQKEILGYVYSPFRAHDFFNGIFETNRLNDIGIRVYPGILNESTTPIYNSYGEVIPVSNTLKGESFEKIESIFIAGQIWTITYKSIPGYGDTVLSRFASLGIIAIGLIISILTTLFVYTFTSSRQKAIAYAKDLNRDLTEAQAKDEAVLSSIGDGLVVLDKDGVITRINKAFTEILGFTKEESIGRELTDIVNMYDSSGILVSPEKRTATRALTEKKRIQTNTSEGLQYKKKDGTLFPIALTISPVIDSGGNVVGAVEVFRDITKEDEIDRAKSEFVSLASHQLRTPLSAIGWYTELLIAEDAGKINKEQKEYLSEIYEGNNRMVELVNALLNVSRLELGTFMVEPKMANIVELAESVIKEQHITLKHKSQKLKVHFDKDLKEMCVDTELLRMVYQNLLSNAIKYTPEKGTITFTIKNEKQLSVVRITVADTGMGIPEEQQKKIFSKLFRADNVKETDTEGTGLGLYIVKAVVEEVGGEISFTSKEGEGTTFIVDIPKEGMKRKEGEKKLS